VALKASALPKVNGKRERLVIITQGAKQTVVAHKGKVRETNPLPCCLDGDGGGGGDN